MLVHICCAVDSHYFLQKLQEEYPHERLIGFFYDPNIHPYSEYYLRLLEVKRSCEMLGIELIEGEYDTESWLEAVRGFEKEPEKGARCSICFDRRFEVSAQKASELGEKSFTSTLLTSPKKSIKQLKLAGDSLAKNHGISFVAPDYRKVSGTQEQNIMAKKDQLYRQNYCGCIFGLTMQREQQQKIADELFSPISQQILPESIEARIELYEKRIKFEEQNIEYRIVKERFLNWRIKFGLLRVQKEPTPAHFLPYSTIKSEYTRGRIDYNSENLYYMNRDEIKFISLEYYNFLAKTNYESIEKLIFNPPSFQEELKIIKKITTNSYNLSTIIITKHIPTKKVEIILQSHVYQDVQELIYQI